MLFREQTKIVMTNGFDVAPLLSIYGSFGGLDVASSASLDLDEAKHVFVPSDEIDFAVMPRGTEISRDHDVAAATKVEVGVFLSATTGAKVGGSVFTYC